MCGGGHPRSWLRPQGGPGGDAARRLDPGGPVRSRGHPGKTGSPVESRRRMNLWLYSFREMAQRPGRSLLTLFSIILSVGTVYAVLTTSGGARIEYSRMTEALSG